MSRNGHQIIPYLLYKARFSKSTVFPKLHILEKHTVPVAFGLMGEQGAESIHKWFNEQKRVYGSLADGLQKLHCMHNERTLHTHFPDKDCSTASYKEKKIFILIVTMYSPHLIHHDYYTQQT